MDIQETRRKAKLTQKQAASFLNIPLRTYARYESAADYCSEIKKEYILKKLSQLTEVSEDKGILSIDDIQSTVSDICEKHDIGYCILFGSYAKGTCTASSDVDLLVNTAIKGLSFFGLVDEFRERLHKKVDIIRIEDAMQNRDLLNDILKEGIRVYAKQER